MPCYSRRRHPNRGYALLPEVRACRVTGGAGFGVWAVLWGTLALLAVVPQTPAEAADADRQA